MAKRFVRVTFEDGRAEEYRIKPAHLIAAEEAVGNLAAHPYKATLHAAYAAARPGCPFAVWVDDVDELEEAVENDAGPSTETAIEPA